MEFEWGYSWGFNVRVTDGVMIGDSMTEHFTSRLIVMHKPLGYRLQVNDGSMYVVMVMVNDGSMDEVIMG